MSLFDRLASFQGCDNNLKTNNNDGINNGEENESGRSNNLDPPLQPTTSSTSSRSHVGSGTIEPKAGIVLKTLKPGDVTNYPRKGDTCTIHYEAFTEKEIQTRRSNPVPFDSSRRRGLVFRFRLGAGQVIEGMDVAVSEMSLGQEVEVTFPHPYAYGVAGYPPVVSPRTTLIFRIELIQFSSLL
mmetsp:Transcript_1695/g.3732  ORF Transcript_1695/g.3732 Transcript_1695/m.3732 type:complete len:184 (-) Transcript_1695:156-707(-)|eukprot:CAMPEP_0171356700 /NCGR_PEP_ID=MMETSP0878-20121228/45866_1 /TAXON_ID=67004 /ORGANISM="Thalassiosira weissflogii, Strain CCMP1336" /LENGTH=183 /DNA_ID=CAMNT_0011862727 /DNA_START=603 /DNA_END=1154 /DNA_ORIENTATION=-